MCDYTKSSQLHSWLYESPDMLRQCRSRANLNARKLLSLPPGDEKAIKGTTLSTVDSVVESFACGYYNRHKNGEISNEDDIGSLAEDYATNKKGHSFLDPSEEELLVSFYASFLPSLIGPHAEVRRLQREPKITATAALLLRRFFLSNSVMLHDPKAIMVAAAFLSSKIEDAMTDIRYLEDATELKKAKCSSAEIVPAEIALLGGIRFDCLCFHPYKAVVALTEDLRTFLKSEKGKTILIRNTDSSDANSTTTQTISGRDLEPMYDLARQFVDDVIVSDIPLLYNPGQIGLAALMVANEDLAANYIKNNQNMDISDTVTEQQQPQQAPPLQIDFMGYVRERFRHEQKAQGDAENLLFMENRIQQICSMIRGLKEGKHGCANHNIDMAALKVINKKLKKCKVWGMKEKSSSKKRKHDE